VIAMMAMLSWLIKARKFENSMNFRFYMLLPCLLKERMVR